MISEYRGGVQLYKFHSFNLPEITHAVFTRQGGVSPKPWDSLNMGGLVGDDPHRVEQNRKRAFQLVGRDPDSMYDVWQVHSADVVCVSTPRPVGTPHIKADAILTDNPQTTLFMRFADCVPILLYDSIAKVVGLVHAGWRGTVKRIAWASVKAMIQKYGCQVENIRAGIGPSICPTHYEVGSEVADQVEMAFGNKVNGILCKQNGTVKLDLWEANRTLLSQLGLQKIEVSGFCTAGNLEEWYSHRGESGETGRFGVLIGLN